MTVLDSEFPWSEAVRFGDNDRRCLVVIYVAVASSSKRPSTREKDSARIHKASSAESRLALERRAAAIASANRSEPADRRADIAGRMCAMRGRSAPSVPQPLLWRPGDNPECLTVNVWTPDVATRELPVMVWLHSGAAAGQNRCCVVPSDGIGARLVTPSVIAPIWNWPRPRPDRVTARCSGTHLRKGTVTQQPTVAPRRRTYQVSARPVRHHPGPDVSVANPVHPNPLPPFRFPFKAGAYAEILRRRLSPRAIRPHVRQLPDSRGRNPGPPHGRA